MQEATLTNEEGLTRSGASDLTLPCEAAISSTPLITSSKEGERCLIKKETTVRLITCFFRTVVNYAQPRDVKSGGSRTQRPRSLLFGALRAIARNYSNESASCFRVPLTAKFLISLCSGVLEPISSVCRCLADRPSPRVIIVNGCINQGLTTPSGTLVDSRPLNRKHQIAAANRRLLSLLWTHWHKTHAIGHYSCVHGACPDSQLTSITSAVQVAGANHSIDRVMQVSTKTCKY